MKVTWIGKPELQIFGGDEIEILRGFGNRESDQIQATRIRDKTRGTSFRSDVEGILSGTRYHNFDPPIIGYVKNIQMLGHATIFELEEKAPPIISGILRECAKFIDPKLYERCKDKDYHDVVTNAFPILEDKIRAKIGADPSYSGRKLIDYAFNPNTGKLTLGETKSEREAFYFIFQGALGFLRNPPSHRFTEGEGNIEAFEVISMVDLLLRIVDKAKLHPPERKTPTQDRSVKRPRKESPGAWIELLGLRKEHSIKIKDEALKPWLSKVEEYCKIDVTYSYDVHKMVGVEPRDPTDLEFFDVAKSHLETKYPDIVKAWEELKRVTSELNEDIATFLEEIRTLTTRELKMPAYYSTMRGRSPKEYITLDRFVRTIHEEMEYRTRIRTQACVEHKVHPERKWMIGEPKIEPVMYGEDKFYTLVWGSYRLVINRDEKKVKKAKSLISKILDTSKFKDEVKDLIEREDGIYKTKRKDFEMKIKDLIKSIELGNILKGECRFCT